MRIASNVNSVDTWSWVHLFGCAFLVFAFREMGLGLRVAGLLTISLGFIWECLDGAWHAVIRVYYYIDVKYSIDNIFDRRGFSWLDLAFDAGGIALSVVVILIF